MNPYGSYRALLGNAISALIAAIEIYNKPKATYRDECTAILLVNAWELLLKGVLSKKRVRIFYPKRRGEPYRTYGLSDALNKATTYFPAAVDFHATAKNIELLADYRDNAVHFYNERGFGVIVYALAQTAITNFRDLIKSIFDKDISDEITLSLLPLALGTPLDPVEFVRASQENHNTSASVRQFTERLKTLVVELEDQNRDTGRLFTVFKAKLESTKKIAKADFVVGVQAQGAAVATNPMLVHRPIDPNSTHPHREADIIAHKDGAPGLAIIIGEQPLTQHPFRALTAYLKAKEDPRYYWRDKTGAVTRYSDLYVDRLRKVSPEEVTAALKAYRKRKNA